MDGHRERGGCGGLGPAEVTPERVMCVARGALEAPKGAMGGTQGKGPQAGQLDTGFPLHRAPAPRSGSVRLPRVTSSPRGPWPATGGGRLP